MLDRILRLRPTQRKRILQLIELYQAAASQREGIEIREALEEILLRDPGTLTATAIELEQSKDARKALGRHRAYVGAQIKKGRQRLGISQEELAKRAGIPQSHVCRLETGKHAPTYRTIEKLAQALGITPAKLDPGFDD